MGGRKAHKRCRRCDQSFWHLDVAICVDPFGQLFRKEFWECVASIKEHPPENLTDQVVSVDEVGVRRGVLSDDGYVYYELLSMLCTHGVTRVDVTVVFESGGYLLVCRVESGVTVLRLGDKCAPDRANALIKLGVWRR